MDLRTSLRFLSLIVGFFFVSLHPGPGSGTEQQDFIERITPHGHINWSERIAVVKTTGPASEKPEPSLGSRSQTSLVTQDTAARLFEIVQKVRIDISTQVADLVKNNAMISSQLQNMTRMARPVQKTYASTGTVETTFAIDLAGGFAQLALPAEIKPLPEIKRIQESKPGETGDSGQGAPLYSGFVFDARGLNGVPAMVPRIMNENGEVIYGPAYVSREYAVQHGMAIFVKNLHNGKENIRVAGRPLIVKCLETRGAMPCNFVISNAEASRIRSTSENLKLLRQCKVVIILDSGPVNSRKDG